MTVEQLVDHFRDLGLAQYDAIEMDQHSKFSRLYFQMKDVETELRSRDGDQRRALLPLLQHPNAQVRLRAAFATWVLATEVSRATLQLIWDQKEFPQAADAIGMINAVDEGRYVPS